MCPKNTICPPKNNTSFEQLVLWSKLGRHWLAFGPKLPNLDELCTLTNVAKLRPTLGPTPPNLVDVGPRLAKLGHFGPHIVPTCPILARIGPTTTKFGRHLLNIDQVRPTIDRTWSLWATRWSNFGQSWSIFGRLRPNLVELVHLWASFGQVCSRKPFVRSWYWLYVWT